MHPLKSVKDIWKLTWRIAALNQFISKSIDKCLSFFKILKGDSKFTWDDNCQRVLDNLKSYLNSPLLVSPEIWETFFLYLATSDETLTAILVKKTSDGQSPIFYINRALQTLELNYSKIEK